MSSQPVRQASHAWYDRAVFYHIYPLGMLGASGDGLIRLDSALDHLSDLGISALYIGPLFMSSTHGYDTTDYYNVDPRLGSNDDLAHFVSACHNHNIKVILDGVFNHVSRDFWGFKEALQKGPASQAWNWFVGLHEDPDAPNGVRYDTWEGHESLVKLNLDGYDMRQHIFGAIDFWIEHFDIDGLRLDAADCLSKDFVRAMRKHVDTRKPDFYLMGEVIHGDYRDWANQNMFDGTTNYEAYKGIWSSANDPNCFEIAYSLNRQFGPDGIYRGLSMYSFVENHDVVRLASVLKREDDIPTCYALMFLMPGIPSIYYAGEWGKRGKKGQGFEADLAIRPNISPEDLSSGQIDDCALGPQLCSTIKKLAACRAQSDDLIFGNYNQIDVQQRHLIFSRGQTICTVSFYAEPHHVSIKVDPGLYCDVLNDKKIIDAPDGMLHIALVPHFAQVFVKK